MYRPTCRASENIVSVMMKVALQEHENEKMRNWVFPDKCSVGC